MAMRRTRFALFLGTIIFGITDSLVSTVGLLAGLSAAGASNALIIVTGVVYAIVEAFSMAVGNFLSEETAEEITAGRGASGTTALAAAALMFVTFVAAAFIPVAPYVLLEGPTALYASIVLSVAALFCAGAIGARVARVPALWRGTRMMLLGGAAIAIGLVVGSVLPAA
jgi:VIT1/CCC1 family predicted Fe2+/Mn2+ transporter